MREGGCRVRFGCDVLVAAWGRTEVGWVKGGVGVPGAGWRVGFGCGALGRHGAGSSGVWPRQGVESGQGGGRVGFRVYRDSWGCSEVGVARGRLCWGEVGYVGVRWVSGGVAVS